MEQQLNLCPIRQQALLQPQALAITSPRQALSYEQLDQLLNSITEQLTAQGLKTGDRLVCIAENSLNLILLQLSCMRSGVIFCPINPRFSAQEIQTRLNMLNSHFIWYEQINADLTLNCLAFDFTLPNHFNAATAALKIDSQQVINIIFTSGSSGQPKAVMHNFCNHFYSAQGSQTIIPLAQGDRNLLSLPLFHISGYAAVFRTLLAGATLVLAEQGLTVALLKTQQITHLSLVATQLQRLLADLQFRQTSLAIKHLLLGGSTFAKGLLTQTLERGFTYHLSYGLTEMSSQVATSCNSQSLTILPDREVKIVAGEILLRGKTRFVGYFNSQQENNVIPQTQWFSSNDLGKKSAGTIEIIGRKDRQFISGGENIQPEEIESVLVNFPTVKQAYVVALEDATFGQRPVAFIDWADQQQHIELLDNYIRSKLTSFKCPIHYFPLPLQKGLKVSLTDLKRQAEADIPH